ncbi:MAG: hypothetical protein VYA67_21955 [Actinomycetota bacterium]|nr:hypothetical protein [Actinomycetota bacterium]
MTLPFGLPAELGVELLDQDTTEAEALGIAWLSARTTAAIRRDRDDPLPFAVVREVANTEDCQQIDSFPVLSVHTLAETEVACAREARLNHRRMLYLARNPDTDITVDGQTVNLLWLETVHGPIWLKYECDTVFRKVARYQLALPFTDIEE